MKNILCIADSCCDIIFGGMERIPEHGQEEYCRRFAMKAGGGANTPIGIGRLGGNVRYITRLGRDLPGQLVAQALKENGVVLTGHGIQEHYRTPVSAVLSTVQDRCFASYAGGEESLLADAQTLKKEIGQADIVHTYLGYCETYPIAELCSSLDTELSLDLSYADCQKPELILGLLNQVRYLKLNEEEARMITGCSDLEKAADRLKGDHRTVIITRGALGSLAYSAGGVVHQDCVSYGQTADTCGAGDMFAAGFLYGMAAEETLTRAMLYGARASGQCVTYEGGMDPAFSREKVIC